MKKYLVPVFLILIVLPSCKKKLSKKNAEKQIEMGQYPIAKEFEFTKGFSDDYETEGRGLTVVLGEEEFEGTKRILDTMASHGLISFETIPHREETTAWLMGTTVRTWNEVKVILTPEGKKHLLRENKETYTVKLCDIDFDAIKSIYITPQYSGGKKTRETASVAYTTSCKDITPFGKMFGYSENQQNYPSASFLKEADGWKIAKVK
ncbi:MAG TPA: hypothetical protein VGO58_09145 [Chitinophagaceae bacterium]|jgi:hypothetical protein|nr:hypothetical protein [Chitinophagaceae bacterium]